jgi:hypothetical protein
MMKHFLKYHLLTFLFLIHSFYTTTAQETLSDSLVIQAYAEGYVSWVPGNTTLRERPGFIYHYSTQNKPALNLAAIRLQYESQRFRTSAALITGTYPKRNLVSEKSWARNIGEAYAGYRLLKKEQLWLDAGVFPSHIGAESYIGKENFAATRALISDNTPYYETGIRVSYRPSEKWYISMLALNGWQRISAPFNSFGANWGMQLQYTPTQNFTFNNSSFIGKVQIANEEITRIYSNSYAIFKLSKKDLLQIGWDIGFQDRTQTIGVHIWNAFLAQYRHTMRNDKWSILLRAEKIADPHNVLYKDVSGEQFLLNLLSANIDWNADKRMLFRLEWNHQFGKQSLFQDRGLPARRLSGLYLIACFDLKSVFRHK